MQALALVVLLALSTSAGEAETGHWSAIAGLRARQAPVSRVEILEPCARARQIVRQPACTDRADCPAFRFWQRTFGAPRFEPAETDRGLRDSLIRSTGSARIYLPSLPDRQRRLEPGTPCPAATDLPR